MNDNQRSTEIIRWIFDTQHSAPESSSLTGFKPCIDKDIHHKSIILDFYSQDDNSDHHNCLMQKKPSPAQREDSEVKHERQAEKILTIGGPMRVWT